MSTGDHLQEFNEFYRQHRKRLAGYLRSIGTESEIVDEVIPLAFMIVRRHWDRVCTANPKAYLFKVARNEACRRAKHGYLPQPCISVDVTMIDIPAVHNEVDGLADRLADQQLVKCLLNRLPPRQREILTLRFIEGFTVEEAAGMMKITTGTIKRGTFDALAKLTALVEDPDNPDGRDKEA